MENYLLELIRENNRIIIPNFGAFIVSREKGQNILFNNFLSFNDGLLISHICAEEGLDSAKAAQKVEEYVKKIQTSLDQDGKFSIEGIGTFTKDDNGVLRFEQEAKEEVLSTPEATKPFSTKNTKTEDEELLDLDTSVESGKPEDNKKEEVPTPKTASADRIPGEPAPASASSPNLKVSKFDKQKEKKSPSPKSTGDKNPPIVKNKVVKDVGDNNNQIPVWLIILIGAIVILLVLAYLWFYTSVFDGLRKSDEPEPVKIEKKDEVAEVEEDPSEVMPEPEIEEVEPEPVVTATRQHHIIVGSYRDEGKAVEFMNQLTNKGVTTASVLPYEGRFLVSAEWYPSVSKALQRQEELLEELQMENWVLSITVR